MSILILFLEGQKTDEEKQKEELLLSELMMLVKQRDQLVQIEDTQVQQRYVKAFHVMIIIKALSFFAVSKYFKTS